MHVNYIATYIRTLSVDLAILVAKLQILSTNFPKQTDHDLHDNGVSSSQLIIAIAIFIVIVAVELVRSSRVYKVYIVTGVMHIKFVRSLLSVPAPASRQ